MGETNVTAEVAGNLLKAVKSEFNVDGSLGSRTPEVGTRTPETGLDCTCPTIKNYPTVDKPYPLVDKNAPTADKQSLTRKVRKFSITPDALLAFQAEELDFIKENDAEDE